MSSDDEKMWRSRRKCIQTGWGTQQTRSNDKETHWTVDSLEEEIGKEKRNERRMNQLLDMPI